MIAPTVVSELDNHKYNPKKKIADRARSILKRLEDYNEYKLNSKYLITILIKRSLDRILIENDLDRNSQDDLILASIIAFKSDKEMHDRILLSTNDTGLRLKANSLEIETLKLPDENILSAEKDETEKKLAALRVDLDQLKNRLPKIALKFMDGSLMTFFERKSKFQPPLDSIKQKLEAMHASIPYLQSPKPLNRRYLQRKKF